MAIQILIFAIIGLYIGGILMATRSRGAAHLDARISYAIGRAVIPSRMRRARRRAERFRKNAGRKYIICIYKMTGVAAVILATGLTWFLVSVL